MDAGSNDARGRPLEAVGADTWRALVLEHVPMAIIAMDLAGGIAYVNEAAEALYGIARDRLIGADASSFAISAIEQSQADEIAAALQDRRSWEGDFELRRRDGTIVTVHARNVGLHDSGGELIGVVSIAADVTSERRDRAELVDSRRRLADVVQTLQTSLLPAALPALPGIEVAARYRPAGTSLQVGGDFYDVFATGSGDWGLLIGDVEGKGAEAAAMTALVRYTVRALAIRSRRPEVILRSLNECLLVEAPDLLCTVAYLRLSHAKRGPQLTLGVAGHPLPILVRAGRQRAIGVPGTVLGAGADLEITDVTVRLRAGDVVVLYTDGLPEARNDGAFFEDAGIDTVLAATHDLGPGAIAEELERAAVAFQGGDPRDDIAVLVLKVT